MVQLDPARAENLNSLGKPSDFRLSPSGRRLSFIQHYPNILFMPSIITWF